MKGELPKDWDQEVPVYEKGSSLASRASSGEVLNGIAKKIPFFVGDLLTLRVQIKRQSKMEETSRPKTTPGKTSGSVSVNLRWALH